MKKLLFAFCSIISMQLVAQTQFITSGRIEFEKKVNQHRVIKGQNDKDEGQENFWVAEQLKQLPAYVTDVFSLQFNANKSLYKWKEMGNADNKYMWGAKPSEEDKLVQDVANNKVSLQREVFEKTYIIKDSVRQLNWKITDETRDIAGFQCRKAVAKICDSVVVVAFYTDQIMVSSGPEGMGGLPGMILGLVVPRLHTTWFATKLIVEEYTDEQLNPKQKGDATTWVDLQKELTKALKDWGKYGNRFMWGLLL